MVLWALQEIGVPGKGLCNLTLVFLFCFSLFLALTAPGSTVYIQYKRLLFSNPFII